MITGAVFERRARGAVFVERSERKGVDPALRGVERVEVAIGDADVPGDEAMLADLDAFVGHDQRAVEQGEIADFAGAIFAEREGDAGIAGDMLPKLDRALGRLLRMKRKICAVSR